MTVAPQQLYTLRSSYTDLTYSKDDLRQLVAHVEQSFTQSDIYSRALQRLQDRLGSTANGLQLLVNALGREAIRLTLKEFISTVTQTSTPAALSSTETTATSSTATFATKAKYLTDSSYELGSHAPTVLSEQSSIHPKIHLGTTIDIPEYPVLSDAPPDHAMEHSGHTNRIEQPSIITTTPHPETIASITQKNSGFTHHFTSPNHQPSVRSKLVRPQPSTEREEVLDSIGQTIQKARAQKQISIEQLHQRTCVPGHHIRALEDGMWQNLPEDIYLKGFIRLLGNALELDGQALSHSLAPNLGKSSSPSTVPLARSTTKVSSPKPSAQLNQSHLYLGYAALMAGATGGLAWMVSQPTSSPVDLINQNSNVPPTLSAINQGQQPSFQQLAQRIVKQMSAIATPETIPPEQPSTAVRP